MHWTQLVVTDSDGSMVGTLGGIIADPDRRHMVHTAYFDHDDSFCWPGYFISAAGETPDWDTPYGEVDWSGFTISSAPLVADGAAEGEAGPSRLREAWEAGPEAWLEARIEARREAWEAWLEARESEDFVAEP